MQALANQETSNPVATVEHKHALIIQQQTNVNGLHVRAKEFAHQATHVAPAVVPTLRLAATAEHKPVHQMNTTSLAQNHLLQQTIAN